MKKSKEILENKKFELGGFSEHQKISLSLLMNSQR